MNINKFSSYEKLVKFASYFFKLLCKVQGGDSKDKAKKYWIKIAQSECFSKEIQFLKQEVKSEKCIPSLVSILNIFLGDDDILRSRGRIAKCLYFDYNVYNPVLLPKGHKFAPLIINYCHEKVQHMGTGTRVKIKVHRFQS